MNKSKILYDLWSSFGIPAYDETTVPAGKDKPDFPYLTYEVATDDFGGEVALSCSLWYKSEVSWMAIESKADEIEAKISRGGIIVGSGPNKAWIRRGSPFRQRMGDETDDTIRRILINVTAEFLSAD